MAQNRDFCATDIFWAVHVFGPSFMDHTRNEFPAAPQGVNLSTHGLRTTFAFLSMTFSHKSFLRFRIQYFSMSNHAFEEDYKLQYNTKQFACRGDINNGGNFMIIHKL